MTTAGRNALIAAIALLLGLGTVAAVVRAGGGGGGGGRLAQTGPGTTVAPTPSTAPGAPATTATSAPATTATTAATAGSGTSATTATTAAPEANEGDSGLGTGGAGQVAAGPTMPNTGIESALAPGVALLGAGAGLRLLLAGRRRPHDA